MRSLTETRYGTSCAFLAGGENEGIRRMMRHMRDHHEGGTTHVPAREAQEPRPVSVCMHAESLNQRTAATMITELGGDAAPEAWCSMVTPCTNAFIPVAVGEELPVPLTIAGDRHDERSHWWQMHQLANESEADPKRLTPLIQDVMLGWEQEIWDQAREGEAPSLAEIFATLQEKRDEAATLLSPSSSPTLS
jgi:dipeptidase